MTIDRPGRWRARCYGHSIDETKSGWTMLKLRWVVVAEETIITGKDGVPRYEYRSLDGNEIVTDENAVFMIDPEGEPNLRSCQSVRDLLGWDGVLSSLFPGGSFAPGGKQVVIVSEEDEYKGVTKVRVRPGIEGLNGAESGGVDIAKLKTLEAKLGVIGSEPMAQAAELPPILDAVENADDETPF